jgi:Xaa-Pro aminopeptidase
MNAPPSTPGRTPWRPTPYDVEARRPWKRLPFSDDEYRARQAAVRDLARAKGVRAILVGGNGIDVANVRYLSGFPNHYKGDVVVIVPVDGEPVMLTNAIAHGEPMHIEIYQSAIDDVRCAPSDRGRTQYSDAPSLMSLLEQALSELGLLTARVGVSGYAPTMSLVLQDKRQMVIEDCTHDLLEMRAIKSPAELALMRRAGEICDAALLASLDAARPGASERDVAAAVASTMMRDGGEEALYIIQAVSGPRSAFRNVGASDRILEKGDPMYIGFGLRHGGYCGRIGTGTSVGRPGDRLRTLLEANARITEACIALVRPGVPVVEPVEHANAMARELGVADGIIAGGHGIGIHTHDKPYVQPGSADVFKERMVFVFEPVIYSAGFATANAERVYEVTANGCVSLSAVPLRVWDR